MSDIDIMSLIGNEPLEINCPNCSSKVTFTLKDAGNSIICPKCNSKISLQKKDDFDSSLNSANKSLKDFENSLKNLGK